MQAGLAPSVRKLPVDLSNPEVRDRCRTRLLDAFGAGCTIDTAVAHAGLAENTLRAWWARDEEFAQECASAREVGVLASLTVIQSSARKGDWRAAEAFLRLVRPAEYGGPKVVVSQTNTNAIDQRSVVVEQLIAQLETEIPDADVRYRIGTRLLEGLTGAAGAGIGLDPVEPQGGAAR